MMSARSGPSEVTIVPPWMTVVLLALVPDIVIPPSFVRVGIVAR
jgi:hypothetical protein